MTTVRTAGTKGVPRAVRESQFLDVAAEQIARTGYAGLSLRAVAEQAGVSKPLVYAYFDTKDRLYIACVERAAGILSAAIESAAHGNGRKRAKETFRRVFTALEPRPSDWSVLFDRSHPIDGPVADAARSARRRIATQSRESVAAAFISTGIQPDPTDLSTLADIWMSSFSALVNWWLRHPDVTADVMVTRSHRLIDTLLRAAAGPSNSPNGAVAMAFKDSAPEIDDTAWVAHNATVIGDISIGPGASIWYQAVLRAEAESITVGAGSNIQDGCVLHTDRGFPLQVGAGVSVGHNAILHGCTIGDDVLVGMGATVLNGATIGAGSLVAANALVPQGADIPPGSLVAGVPGKIRRPVTDDELADIRANATTYEELREDHRQISRAR